MNSSIISIIIIVIVGAILISIAISSYNKLIMLKHNIDKAFANIDVILKQRADEIPNLINVVKESMRYEESVIIKLTELRTNFLNATTSSDKIVVSNEIDKTIKSIFSISENYPDLKANQNFMLLQGRVSQMEDAISDRREYFNESVTMYNIGIQEFPTLIFAKILFYKQKPLLEITANEKKYDGIKF